MAQLPQETLNRTYVELKLLLCHFRVNLRASESYLCRIEMASTNSFFAPPTALNRTYVELKFL